MPLGADQGPRLRGGAFGEAVRDMIENDSALSHALLPMLEARQMLLETFLELDRRVRKAANQVAITTLFMSVPGVGYVTALSFKDAVDDPSRFKMLTNCRSPLRISSMTLPVW